MFLVPLSGSQQVVRQWSAVPITLYNRDMLRTITGVLSRPQPQSLADLGDPQPGPRAVFHLCFHFGGLRGRASWRAGEFTSWIGRSKLTLGPVCCAARASVVCMMLGWPCCSIRPAGPDTVVHGGGEGPTWSLESGSRTWSRDADDAEG